MNKPFISEAKRIIDFTTMAPFEDVDIGTHTHIQIQAQYFIKILLSFVRVYGERAI